MIFEALQHFLNQAAPEVKALGYVREAIAIEARYGRCRTDWADHLKNCHQQIMTATAPLKSTSTLMVLGSGALHDLPIGALLAAGHSLILIDIVHLAKIQKRYKTHDRVRFVEQDVTGLVGPLFHKDSLTPLDIKNGTASFLETRFPEVDLVISLNILSQLPINLIQFAEQHDIALPDNFRQAVMAAHLKMLPCLAPRCQIISDLDRSFLEDQTVLEREPFLPDSISRQLSKPDQIWDWHIAPKGEVDPAVSMVHHVASWIINS